MVWLAGEDLRPSPHLRTGHPLPRAGIKSAPLLGWPTTPLISPLPALSPPQPLPPLSPLPGLNGLTIAKGTALHHTLTGHNVLALQAKEARAKYGAARRDNYFLISRIDELLSQNPSTADVRAVSRGNLIPQEIHSQLEWQLGHLEEEVARAYDALEVAREAQAGAVAREEAVAQEAMVATEARLLELAVEGRRASEAHIEAAAAKQRTALESERANEAEALAKEQARLRAVEVAGRTQVEVELRSARVSAAETAAELRTVQSMLDAAQIRIGEQELALSEQRLQAARAKAVGSDALLKLQRQGDEEKQQLQAAIAWRLQISRVKVASAKSVAVSSESRAIEAEHALSVAEFRSAEAEGSADPYELSRSRSNIQGLEQLLEQSQRRERKAALDAAAALEAEKHAAQQQQALQKQTSEMKHVMLDGQAATALKSLAAERAKTLSALKMAEDERLARLKAESMGEGVEEEVQRRVRDEMAKVEEVVRLGKTAQAELGLQQKVGSMDVKGVVKELKAVLETQTNTPGAATGGLTASGRETEILICFDKVLELVTQGAGAAGSRAKVGAAEAGVLKHACVCMLAPWTTARLQERSCRVVLEVTKASGTQELAIDAGCIQALIKTLTSLQMAGESALQQITGNDPELLGAYRTSR